MGMRGPAAVRFFAGYTQNALSAKERRPLSQRPLPESQGCREGLLPNQSCALPSRRVRVWVIFSIRRNGGHDPERPISRNTEKANQKSPNGRFLATTAPREVFCSRHRCPQWSFFEVVDGILRRRYGTRLGETSVRVPAGDHCCGPCAEVLPVPGWLSE